MNVIVIAVPLLTYVWHYLLARVIYDQLVRPLEHGRAGGLILALCVGAAAFALGRATRRRATRRRATRRVG